jgi:MFS family permease
VQCVDTALLWYTVQVGGIIAGQLGLGYLADRIGRKWGSVVTAATMLAGGVLLACSNGPTVHAMFIVSTCAQFLPAAMLLSLVVA